MGYVLLLKNKMTEKREIAIVFGITKNLTFALGNVILGLKKHSPNFADEIVVFHDGINDKDKEILNSILPCRFIDYEFPIKDQSKFDPFFFEQFSSMAYSRFECFSLFEEFEKVIWLDVDILIQKDISGLLEYTETGIGMLPGDFIKHNFKEPVKEFNMEKLGFWTGTIIITDEIKEYNRIADWCYEKLLEYAPKLYLPDQAIFNIMLEAFNLAPMGINKKIYCAHPVDKTVKDAVIVHAYRPKKFWDCFRMKEWVENDKQWQKMGGTPYKGKRCSLLEKFIESRYPGAPNPVKKPRAFIKYLYTSYVLKPYKGMN